MSVNNMKAKAMMRQRKYTSAKPAVRTAARLPAKEVIYAPVAKATIARTLRPVIKTLPNGSTRIVHSEYIGEVFGSANYNVASYAVQPGIANTFPWLSLMAPLYETYHINKLKFKFVTEKSTATNGAVMLAMDFDAQDSAPASKTALLSYHNAVRSQPWADCTYVANPSDVNKLPNRYVRTAPIVSGDLKTFDVGNFFIATQGCADTSVLGELHIEYDIEFKTPQLDLGNFASAGSNFSGGTVGITGILLLGTSPALNNPGSGMPITYNTTTGAISFGQVGSYLVTFIIFTASSAGNTIVTPTGGSQVAVVTDAGATGVRTIQFTIKVANISDTFTFSGTTLTTPTASVLRIASYPFGL